MRRLPFPVPVLLVVSTGCSSVVHRPEVAALVAQVDEGRLREHVEALGRIGPRPRGEEAATRETVAYLTRTLRRRSVSCPATSPTPDPWRSARRPPG